MQNTAAMQLGTLTSDRANQTTGCLGHSSSCKLAFFRGMRAVHSRQHPSSHLSQRKHARQQRARTDTPGTPPAAATTAGLRTLHPQTKAVESGQLKVSDVHTLSYEVRGNPKGRPVLVVHGGPGAGCYANHARFFDARKWKIVLVDQRGCGASTPRGCLQDNNTQELIKDFEKLRVHLRVKRWMLFGGSWGVALSLAYAEQHPTRVLSLVLRGVCLMRDSEIDWMYRGGAGHLNPLGWHNFEQHVAEQGQEVDMVEAYHTRLTSADTAVRDAAAKNWLGWEFAASSGRTESLQWWNGSSWQQSAFPASSSHQTPPPAATANGSQKAQHDAQANTHGRNGSPNSSMSGASAQPSSSSGNAIPAVTDTAAPAAMSSFTAQAMLECHYSKHHAFLESTPLLQGVNEIRHIPCIAVQGRLDFVCPVKTAYDLHCQWPEMELRVVPGAGHSMYDPSIAHELLEATDRMRQLPLPPPPSQDPRSSGKGRDKQLDVAPV